TDVQFHSLFLLEEGETKWLRSVVERDGESVQFRVESAAHSLQGDEESQTVHAICTIAVNDQQQPLVVDVSGLRERCNNRSLLIGAGEQDPNTEGFGPRWQGIKSYHYGEQE